MGCCQSGKKAAIVLFPPDRHCTDVFWIILFGLLGAFSVACVSYCGVTANLSTYIERTPNIHWEDYWDLMGICAAFALVFTLILTAVMQYLTRVAVYTFIAIGTLTSIALMIYFWFLYADEGSTTDLYVAISMTIFTAFWIVFVIYIASKIELILTLYEIAASLLSDQPLLLVIAVVCFLVYAAGCIIFGVMLLVVLSAKWEASLNTVKAENQKQSLLNAVLALVLFVGIWFQCFVFACSKFLIGYVVGLWYFTTDKKTLQKPIKTALKFLFRFHFGSMLLGSFVMAVIHFVRMLLEYLRQMKSQNGIMNCLALIAICIIDCCKSFWDMLSTNAYYLIAMFGLNFCSALNLGMELTSLGVTSLFYMVGNIMVNVGITLVVVGSTLCTMWIVNNDIEEDKVWQAYLILILIGLLISSVILTVYSTVTRALYVCVCVDIRQSPNMPFTKVPGLVAYIEKSQTNIIRNENMV